MRRLVYDAERIGRWVSHRTGGELDRLGTAIGIEEDGELIAGVLYESYNGRSICAHVAGEGKNWMTREFLRQIFHYPFVQLKVCKIIGIVDSTNLAARHFDEALGFVLEHTVRYAGPKGDMLIYSMTPAQCRFLGIKERVSGKVVESARRP